MFFGGGFSVFSFCSLRVFSNIKKQISANIPSETSKIQEQLVRIERLRGTLRPHIQIQRLTSNSDCLFDVSECLFVSPQDSILFIEQHKSGFERPADVEFEDYTQGIKPATSDSSLHPPKVRAKLWPFSKKNKVNLLASDSLLFEFT